MDYKFVQSEQVFGETRTYQAVAADIDADGYPDLICSNMGINHSQVFFNDGKGSFTESEQKLTQQGHGIGACDFDNDGDIDIIITCAGWEKDSIKYSKPTKIYFNNGKGQFQDSEQDLGDTDLSGNSVHLADFDGDNNVDAFIEYYNEPDILYLNDGKGIFSKGSISIPESSLPLDVDNDGDTDIFIREKGYGFKIKINDGNGIFSPYCEIEDTTVVDGFSAVGDIDNDNDLDIILTNGNYEQKTSSRILFNDGKGNFTYSEQELPSAIFGRIDIGDLNGDCNMDVFFTSLGNENEIWINTGSGFFEKSNLKIDAEGVLQRPLIVDLNNDRKNDVFITNFLNGSNQIWFYTED